MLFYEKTNSPPLKTLVGEKKKNKKRGCGGSTIKAARHQESSDISLISSWILNTTTDLSNTIRQINLNVELEATHWNQTNKEERRGRQKWGLKLAPTLIQQGHQHSSTHLAYLLLPVGRLWNLNCGGYWSR